VTRTDGRRPDQLRPVVADPAFLEQPHGMVLWSQGGTRVLCTASIEERVPRWLHRTGRGWVTAEYSLLPASTGEPALFRELGERFLQLPLGDVEHVMLGGQRAA